MRPGGKVPPPEYVAEILPAHFAEGCLSVAVFGPGRGEAIVVQLPDGAVGVVDGCREPFADDPEGRGDPVRELLSRLAKERDDPEAFRLAFVCLTHPHDDHYGGLGRLLRAYEGRVSEVWTVSHLVPKYRNALLGWLKRQRRGTGAMPDQEDIHGLDRVFDAFDAASTRDGSTLMHLGARKRLIDRSIGAHRLSIEACGPADADVDQAGKDLAALLRARQQAGMPPPRGYDPNLTSAALLLRWGSAAILLGGDLLRGDAEGSGWQLASREIVGAVQVVNVAHHASAEAHHDALWRRMAPALAIVTPFHRATGNQPPRPERIAELARTSVVAITAPPAWPAAVGLPAGMQPRDSPVRSFDPRNDALISLTPSKPADAIRNAVAVSLDAAGTITRFVLAGDADIYVAPDDAHRHR